MPWGIDQDDACFQDVTVGASVVRVPRIGERCILADGASYGGPNYGHPAFDTSSDDCPDGSQSAKDYETHITEGVDLVCAIGEFASSNSGASVGRTRSGLEARLASDGACDFVYPAAQVDLGSVVRVGEAR